MSRARGRVTIAPQRRPIGFIAAICSALLAAGRLVHQIAFDAPAAQSPSPPVATTDDAWLPPNPRLDAAPAAAALPPATTAPPPQPERSLAAAARWGTLVSHGSGVLVQEAPTAGIGRALDLSRGDRIVRVNGVTVTQAADVLAAVDRLTPDATLQIDGIRDGKPIRLLYSAEQQPPSNDAGSNTP